MSAVLGKDTVTTETLHFPCVSVMVTDFLRCVDAGSGLVIGVAHGITKRRMVGFVLPIAGNANHRFTFFSVGFARRTMGF